MADVQTARLCGQIIHSHFGPLTATVASILLSRGRLPLSQVVRYASLKPRTVRAVVLVLVQHNLLWHAHIDGQEEEGLEFNIEECLSRLRYGRYVWLVESLFGQHASEIVQVILDHGKLRLPDIMVKIAAFDPRAEQQYKDALYRLVSTLHLKPATILAHKSPRDKRIKYEAEEKAKIGGIPSAKSLREAKVVAAARLKREEEEAEKIGLIKKAKEIVGRLGKRKQTDEVEVDGSVYFRVNCEKFNIHIRNALIEKASKERYNEGASKVMKAILKATESRQLKMSEIRSEAVSANSVGLQLANEDNLSAGLILPTRKASNGAAIKEYLGLLSCADNPTPSGKAASFITWSSSKVTVEFEVITKRMRRRLIEAVARERHGNEGVRILRLLLDLGKLDEKQISKAVMMASKDVRPLLAAMTADSLISTQEVAKSADRNPTRMFYLWYVDVQRSLYVILGNFYKTLYNIGVRRQAEQEIPEVKAVLEKRERSDVQLDESLLTRLERDILAEWQNKQEKLTVLEARVEDAVFVLRDLGVYGYDDE